MYGYLSWVLGLIKSNQRVSTTRAAADSYSSAAAFVSFQYPYDRSARSLRASFPISSARS